MSERLLIASSSIFDNSNLTDQIRQTEIDLFNDPDLGEITNFINNSLIYLNKYLTNDEKSELFSIILLIFSHYTEDLLPAFNTFMIKSRSNANYIIITLSILSYLTHIHPELQIQEYSSFVCDVINEIWPQLSNQSNNIKIFGYEISQQFQNDLILNAVLSSNLKEKISSKLYRYIFYHNCYKMNEKFDLFIQDLLKENLISILPKTNTTDSEILKYFSQQKDQQFFTMSDETFSYIISTFTYIKSCGEIEIKGLNVETILPFTAFISIFLKNPQIDSTFSKEIDYNLIQEAAKSLTTNNSELLSTSVNIILENYDYLTKSKLIQTNQFLNFFYILIGQLEIEKNKFDAIIFLKLFIRIMSTCKVKSYYTNCLFDYMMLHLNEIIDHRKEFSYRSFNLGQINKNLIIYQSIFKQYRKFHKIKMALI